MDYAMHCMMRRGMLLVAGVLALALSGCVKLDVLPLGADSLRVPLSEPYTVSDEEVQLRLERAENREYRIGARDIVRVDVRKDPTLSLTYTVTDEGYILLPNIGPVQVEGMTTQQVETDLNELLAAFIREPEAKVGVQQYRSKVVYVVGQVNRPGPQVMRADVLTLQEAVFQAQLPTDDAALKRTKIIKPHRDRPVVKQVNLTDVLYRGKMRHNVLLEPNDIVYIPARFSANFSAVVRELVSPAESVTSLQSRSNFTGFARTISDYQDINDVVDR